MAVTRIVFTSREVGASKVGSTLESSPYPSGAGRLRCRPSPMVQDRVVAAQPAVHRRPRVGYGPIKATVGPALEMLYQPWILSLIHL